MMVCKKCGSVFPRRTIIDGKKVDLGSYRVHCLDCLPYNPGCKRRRNIKCKNCGKIIPAHAVVDGKRRNLSRRKYCLECSPFGSTYYRRKNSGGKPPTHMTNRRSGWLRKKRHAFKKRVVEYLGGHCSSCGYDENYATLIPHHRDPETKEMNISEMTNWKWEKVRMELDK